MVIFLHDALMRHQESRPSPVTSEVLSKRDDRPSDQDGDTVISAGFGHIEHANSRVQAKL